jgi:hypothetical protein
MKAKQMIYDFFVFDTFFFWAASAIPLAFLVYFVFNEKGSNATLTVFLTLVAITLFSNIPVLDWMRHLTPAKILAYVGGYFAIGVIYMLIKWVWNSFEIKMKYADFREAWLQDNKLTQLPASSTTDINEQKLLKAFAKDLFHTKDIIFDDLPPKIRNHRGDLIFWASYWHLSLLFTLLNNPLRHLINFILNFSSKPLNAISAAMFSNYKELN